MNVALKLMQRPDALRLTERQIKQLELLRGEIIAVATVDVIGTAATFALVVASLVLFQKEFLLVSYDREMAVTLKKRVLFWDAFLFSLIGLTISVSVCSSAGMSSRPLRRTDL